MLNEFIENYNSVVLSTLDDANAPFTSYAPFIRVNNNFYIFISDIAKHAQNIQRDERCSLFFIEDEKDAKSIFARKRIVLQANASKVDCESSLYTATLDSFEESFGQTVTMLKKMKDFNLYEITPLKGEAVFGFGEAYDIKCTDELELVERTNQKGHAK